MKKTIETACSRKYNGNNLCVEIAMGDYWYWHPTTNCHKVGTTQCLCPIDPAPLIASSAACSISPFPLAAGPGGTAPPPPAIGHTHLPESIQLQPASPDGVHDTCIVHDLDGNAPLTRPQLDVGVRRCPVRDMGRRQVGREIPAHVPAAGCRCASWPRHQVAGKKAVKHHTQRHNHRVSIHDQQMGPGV